MTYPRVIPFVALLLLLTGSAIAQDELLDAPRRLEQVTFSSPTTASIRLTSGVRRTGKVLSISRESIVYQVGRDNKEVRVPIDEIERVNTLDGEFTYEPAREDFERLKIKARRISNLRVETVETYIAPPDGVQESRTPRNSDPPPSVPDANPNPAPTPAGTNPPVEVTSDPTQPTEPSVEIPDDEPQPGQLVLFCGNCGRRLPLSIKNGDVCPHCGLVLYNLPGRTQSGARPAGAGGHRNPGSDVSAYPDVPGNQPAAANSGTAPGTAAGGGQVTAQGFSLSDVPVWAQVGFFVGLLAVGWLLLQRR